MEVVTCLKWIELHKDFWLIVAALVAPFAAVFVALVSSKRQARALLESTRMQVNAAAFREYRQRNIEKLREELSAEIFYVSELRFIQQRGVGLNDLGVQGILREAHARKIRIGLLVRAGIDCWKQCFELETQLVERIKGARPGKVWSKEENGEFDRQLDAFGTLCFRVVEREVQAAAGNE